MSENDPVALLALAEQEMLRQISSPPLREDGSINYDRLDDYLNLAHRIGDVRNQARILLEGPNPSSARTHTTQDTPARETRRLHPNSKRGRLGKQSFPIYFVQNGTLYKFGESADPDKPCYRRAIPMKMVERVCDDIAALAREGYPITAAALSRRMENEPGYKFQVICAALEACGILTREAKGRYKLISRTPPDTWAERLRALPREEELIELSISK